MPYNEGTFMSDFTQIHYALHIVPDLVELTFEGQLEITLTPAEPLATLTLNAVDLEIERCNARQGPTPIGLDFALDAGTETMRIRLDTAVSETFALDIAYRGTINDRMAGFYRSAYRWNGQKHFMAVTQFQESDARRALPCFDHPRHKATFDIEMTVDADLTAISNGAVREATALGGGRKRVRFERTPRMSTYLVFFGVGRFESRQDGTDQRVRLMTPPGGAQYGDLGLECGRQALQFCETYFDIPYPLLKLDLISIPDFAFGAMENWGAVTFRENLLLNYPGVTSKAGQERIFEVTAHEITHQWFGNLVTPSDWRYLWLNESFATYFGFGIVDHYRPEWDIWSQFILSQTDTALRRDGLQETFPIEIPGGEHLVINTSTAPIIYSKGASVLRQIRAFIGDAAFQDGLRHYLRRHAYACADSLQFWEAFEAVSDQPVRTIMRAWVEQPGHPVVRARRDGSRLTLTQERFSYLPGAAAGCWPIPITIRLFDPDGNQRRQQVLMRAETQILDIGPAEAFKINDGQAGFFRVFYEEAEDLAALGRRVRDKRLSPEDRWGLQSDLFARVQAGEAPLEEYLDFLKWYADEDAYLPLVSMDSHLRYTHLVADPTGSASAAAAGRRLAERVLDSIGYTPAAQERHGTAALRDQLLWHAVVYGSETARAFADDAFQRLLAGDSLHPDILKAVLQAGALLYNDRAMAWMTQRLDQTSSEHERLTIMAALGCFHDPRTLAAARDYTLDHVPDRNRFMPLVAMAANPFAVADLWGWFVGAQDRFKDFHPLLFERVIAAIVPVAGLVDPQAVRTFMERFVLAAPQTRDVVKLSLEKLAINRRFREA
jgi:aminopeptidase N